MSLDFGLKEFGVVDPEERLKRYRRYVFEAGSLDRSDKGGASDIVEKEDQTPVKSATLVFIEELNGVNNYEIKRIDRFRYRTRYFMDSDRYQRICFHQLPAV